MQSYWTICLAILAACVSIHTAQQVPDRLPVPDLPSPTFSGYVDVDRSADSAIFYTYYEKQGPLKPSNSTPILLWLQGGPGCASLFGMLYELGPDSVQQDLSLKRNPGAWNFEAGLLFMDQPIGTGFSPAGSEGIPTDEMEMAVDLYAALQGFFGRYAELAPRPFFITGESYAGKYVPSIGHYILQVQNATGPPVPTLQQSRPIPAQAVSSSKPPLFQLKGLAIGNGLVDPANQVLMAADTAFFMGLIDTPQRLQALKLQFALSQLITTGNWTEAAMQRENVIQFLKNCSGAGTMLDPRRYTDYDATDSVSRYLNLAPVKAVMGALKTIRFKACSAEVDAALGPDMMKSVVRLIPDILQAGLPILIYEGNGDGQDGPATAEAWLKELPWVGNEAFMGSQRHLWRPSLSDLRGIGMVEQLPELQHRRRSRPSAEPFVAGYWKNYGPLSQVTIRNAGHMVPHDLPLTARSMIETWVAGVLKPPSLELPGQSQLY